MQLIARIGSKLVVMQPFLHPFNNENIWMLGYEDMDIKQWNSQRYQSCLSDTTRCHRCQIKDINTRNDLHCRNNNWKINGNNRDDGFTEDNWKNTTMGKQMKPQHTHAAQCQQIGTERKKLVERAHRLRGYHETVKGNTRHVSIRTKKYRTPPEEMEWRPGSKLTGRWRKETCDLPDSNEEEEFLRYSFKIFIGISNWKISTNVFASTLKCEIENGKLKQ